MDTKRALMSAQTVTQDQKGSQGLLNRIFKILAVKEEEQPAQVADNYKFLDPFDKKVAKEMIAHKGGSVSFTILKRAQSLLEQYFENFRREAEVMNEWTKESLPQLSAESVKQNLDPTYLELKRRLESFIEDESLVDRKNLLACVRNAKFLKTNIENLYKLAEAQLDGMKQEAVRKEREKVVEEWELEIIAEYKAWLLLLNR